MIKFKTPAEEKEFKILKKRAQIIAQDMAQYCELNGFEFIITDVLSDGSEDKKLKRVSKSHTEGRAFDVRSSVWSEDFRKKLEKHFEEKYKDWAALSGKTLKPNLIEWHDSGHGVHLHIQIKPYKD